MKISSKHINHFTAGLIVRRKTVPAARKKLKNHPQANKNLRWF